jgi:hypothetical protein
MITKNNILEYILLDADGELHLHQQKELQLYLQQDAVAMADWQNITNTTLYADKNIQLKNKLSLYAIANKSAKKPILLKYKLVAGIAVVLALIAGVNAIINKNNTIPIASNTVPTINPNVTKIIEANTNTIAVATIVKNQKITLAKPLAGNLIKTKPIYKYNKTRIISNPKKQLIINNTAEETAETWTTLPQITIKKIPLSTLPNTNFALHKVLAMKPVNNSITIENQKISSNKTVEFTITEPNFFNNNKAILWLKKANKTLANITKDAEQIKQDGITIDINLPNFLSKKPN